MVVLLFGTFDGIHEGHRNLFQQANTYGDVWVIVARDATILHVKGRPPRYAEHERLAAMQREPNIAHAQLGSLGDKYAAMQTIRPDVIALGYDQQAFTEHLEKYVTQHLPNTTIVRLAPFHPDRYSSTLLNSRTPDNGFTK